MVDIVERLRALNDSYTSALRDAQGGDHALAVMANYGDVALGHLRTVIETIQNQRSHIEALTEALEPSAATKAAYIGEFKFNIILRDEDGEKYSQPVTVPWDTTKEIMKAIRARAEKGTK